MPIRDVQNYPGHYLILAVGLIAGVAAFLWLAPSPQIRETALLATALFYIGWGIVHHRITHHLTAKIVLEYSLVATFVVLVITALLLQQ